MIKKAKPTIVWGGSNGDDNLGNYFDIDDIIAERESIAEELKECVYAMDTAFENSDEDLFIMAVKKIRTLARELRK